MPSRRLPVPAHAETTAVGVTAWRRIFAHVARAVTCLDLGLLCHAPLVFGLQFKRTRLLWDQATLGIVAVVVLVGVIGIFRVSPL